MVYPKISVISLTKNNIKELEITLHSVFNQDLNLFIEILMSSKLAKKLVIEV